MKETNSVNSVDCIDRKLWKSIMAGIVGISLLASSGCIQQQKLNDPDKGIKSVQYDIKKKNSDLVYNITDHNQESIGYNQ